MTVATDIRLTGSVTVMAADEEGRKLRYLTGRMITYGSVIHPHGAYSAVRFLPGSIEAHEELGRIKLLRDHDAATPLGVLSALDDDGAAVSGTFRLGSHAQASDAVALVADGILDGLSVGVRVLESRAVEEDDQLIQEVTRAQLREVSLTPIPADDDARVSDVAATRKETPMPETLTESVPPPAAVTASEVGDIVRAALAERAPADAAPLSPSAVVTAAERSGHVSHNGMVIDAEGYGRSGPAYCSPRGERISAGDYMSAYLQARIGGAQEPWQNIRAALAHQKTSDVPGLLPPVIVQPLIDTFNDARPVFDSLSLRVMPAQGAKFSRPQVTQHVKVGVQAEEKTEVVSQPMKLVLNEVAKRTIAGALNVSVQAIDWTSPAILDLIINDFARAYAQWSEADISTSFAAAAGGTPVNADPADPASINKALFTASAAVYKDSFSVPNTVWMSPDVWATLGSLVDKNGRPLYPFLNPQNAFGSLSPTDITGGGQVGPFRVVVGPGLPTGTFIVGNSRYAEVYEDRRGMLRAEEPSVLGVQLAWYGYVATYVSVPKAFVPIKLVPATPEAPEAPAADSAKSK